MSLLSGNLLNRFEPSSTKGQRFNFLNEGTGCYCLGLSVSTEKFFKVSALINAANIHSQQCQRVFTRHFGFGLQNLVNNLVSGLIISFEKPVSVGDIIEISGQRGVVQSIGFRSSIILSPGGANIVIPNGDLLNQQLVNLIRNNKFKAVDVLVGVAYGTNLEHALKILETLPARDERILQSPKPSVIVKQFNSSSIDLQLSFWVKNINDAAALKSDIFLAIDRAFNENAI